MVCRLKDIYANGAAPDSEAHKSLIDNLFYLTQTTFCLEENDASFEHLINASL